MIHIDETIAIGGKTYSMEEKTLVDGLISMGLPQEFTELPAEDVSEKYQMSFSPQMVLSDQEGFIHFSFNLLDEEVKDSKFYISKIKDSIRLIYPETEFFDEGEISGEAFVPFFDFKSSSIDEPIYNLMYLVQLKDNALLGSFNCPFNQSETWKPAVEKMLATITVS